MFPASVKAFIPQKISGAGTPEISGKIFGNSKKSNTVVNSCPYYVLDRPEINNFLFDEKSSKTFRVFKVPQSKKSSLFMSSVQKSWIYF